MSIVRRRTAPQLVDIVTASNNDAKRISTTGKYHWDVSEVVVTAPNATDLASSVFLANQIKGCHNFHCADTLLLKAADAANPVATANAVDLATGITLANALKTAFNAHIASTTPHFTADTTNAVATANATDQTTLNALLNALKTAFNAHVSTDVNTAPSLLPSLMRLVPA
jgi:hypothetical protein